MEITEVSIAIPERAANDLLRAYVKVCIDNALVIHDMRLIRTGTGRMLVAMPCRSLSRPCVACARRIEQEHRYCHRCGAEQPKVDGGITRVDLVHPVTPEGRRAIELAVLQAYVAHASRRPIVPGPAGEEDGDARRAG